jgi:protein-L-isoaspartate(D-aspartate) O-methyltransferase
MNKPFDHEAACARMVDVQLTQRGIDDRRVLAAIQSVPREAFVPKHLEEFAYEDTPLPIGEGQTISQPFIVAFTIQSLELRGGERVLDVGTGSGYAAALLARIAAEVYTIERVPSIAGSARERLSSLRIKNVHVVCGDGSLGLPEHAPYDAIAVAAGAPKPPAALMAQLAPEGRLVIPIGDDPSSQTLVRITRESETKFREDSLTDVRFVPLIGEQGWTDDSMRRQPQHPPPTFSSSHDQRK